MTSFDRLQAIVLADWNTAKAWFTNTAVPDVEDFLKNTIEEELVTLGPIVAAAVGEIVADAGALASPAGWAAVFATVLSAVVPTLEAKAISVANGSLTVAIGAALSKVQATLAAA